MKNSKLVMIPGPTPVARSIMDQMARETVSFKDVDFVQDFKDLVMDLKEMWHAKEAFVVAGTGTLAMEMAVANSVKTGDRVLLISHGYFGDRFIDIFQRRGIALDVLSSEWGKTVDLDLIKEKLAENNYQAVTVTHVDTATGVKANIEAIGEMLKETETIFIVDGVCASAAEREYIEEMGIDILFTGSQKAFGVSPGLAIVWASEKAMRRREALGIIMDSYIDFYKWLPIMKDPMKYYGTPPINLIWALKESVRLIKEEGLEARYARHERDGAAIQAALEAMGFSILAEESCRANTLTNVIYPEGVFDVDFRQTLEEEGVVTAAGLGEYAGKLFRLGHMGNIDRHIVVSTLAAIERALFKSGKEVDFGISIGIYHNEIMREV
jgi:aspartate aminotransferase-like enzyme